MLHPTIPMYLLATSTNPGFVNQIIHKNGMTEAYPKGVHWMKSWHY